MKVIAFPKPRPDVAPPEAPIVEAPPPAPPVVAFGDSGEPPGIERITVRAITVALVLSLFVHLVVLLAPMMKTKVEPPPASQGQLTARLEPQTPASKTPRQPQPRVEPEPPPPQATPQPRPTPAQPRPRLAVPSKQPRATVAPPPPTPVPVPETPQPQPQPQRPPAEDMSSYIAAQRRARGAPEQEMGETDDERAKRIALGNIQAQQRRASPEMVDGGGGLFDLQRTGLTDADFIFKGWSTDFKRNVGLSVHVSKGDAPDIKMAVVRKMIDIIRERKHGEFQWYSPKRGREVTMSASPADQQRLEAFLLHEFYPEDPRGRDVR